MLIGIPEFQRDPSAVLLELKGAGRRAYRHDRGVAESSAVLKHGILNSKPRKGLVMPKNRGIYPLN
jgi:hypothetical protein